jgi:hypothetical protein
MGERQVGYSIHGNNKLKTWMNDKNDGGKHKMECRKDIPEVAKE